MKNPIKMPLWVFLTFILMGAALGMVVSAVFAKTRTGTSFGLALIFVSFVSVCLNAYGWYMLRKVRAEIKQILVLQ